MPSQTAPAAAFAQLPAFDGDELNVVIETPQGSRNKFAFDAERGLFVLKGVLPAGASFPFDFGFVPSTLGDDGDPLDVLVLMDAPAFAGCLVPVRLLGVVEAEQTERDGKTEKNDRLIGVASHSRIHAELGELDDVADALVGEIEHFFISYNQARGKEFKPVGRYGPDRATELVKQGIARARRERKE